jgi:predicted dithiol-disulfide oxidoreductase (DUF899 family)
MWRDTNLTVKEHVMPQNPKSAQEIAESMSRPTIGASAAYLKARKDLLAQEIELRRQTERVAERRRALPHGPAVREDYVFDGLHENGKPGPVRLSELFRDGSDSLLIYSYMFPRHKMDERTPTDAGEIGKLPRDEQPCPSCTGIIDQLDAAVPHFEGLGGNFAVVAKTPLKNLLAVARDRGWRHARLLSSANNSFKRDFNSEDPDGQQEPMTLVFKRDADGTIRLFWGSDMVWTEADPGQDHRAIGVFETFWNMFDLTPGGRPDNQTQIQYPCCDRTAR